MASLYFPKCKQHSQEMGTKSAAIIASAATVWIGENFAFGIKCHKDTVSIYLPIVIFVGRDCGRLDGRNANQLEQIYVRTIFGKTDLITNRNGNIAILN
jgi:hypothetical protein